MAESPGSPIPAAFPCSSAPGPSVSSTVMKKRRALGYWQDFNQWYRDMLATGARPSASVVDAWYAKNAERVWPDNSDRPSNKDARQHAKSLRSTDEVKMYFQRYRAGKKEKQPGASGEEAHPAMGGPSSGSSFGGAANYRRPSSDGSGPPSMADQASMPGWQKQASLAELVSEHNARLANKGTDADKVMGTLFQQAEGHQSPSAQQREPPMRPFANPMASASKGSEMHGEAMAAYTHNTVVDSSMPASTRLTHPATNNAVMEVSHQFVEPQRPEPSRQLAASAGDTQQPDLSSGFPAHFYARARSLVHAAQTHAPVSIYKAFTGHQPPPGLPHVLKSEAWGRDDSCQQQQQQQGYMCTSGAVLPSRQWSAFGMEDAPHIQFPTPSQQTNHAPHSVFGSCQHPTHSGFGASQYPPHSGFGASQHAQPLAHHRVDRSPFQFDPTPLRAPSPFQPDPTLVAQPPLHPGPAAMAPSPFQPDPTLVAQPPLHPGPAAMARSPFQLRPIPVAGLDVEQRMLTPLSEVTNLMRINSGDLGPMQDSGNNDSGMAPFSDDKVVLPPLDALLNVRRASINASPPAAHSSLSDVPSWLFPSGLPAPHISEFPSWLPTQLDSQSMAAPAEAWSPHSKASPLPPAAAMHVTGPSTTSQAAAEARMSDPAAAAVKAARLPRRQSAPPPRKLYYEHLFKASLPPQPTSRVSSPEEAQLPESSSSGDWAPPPMALSAPPLELIEGLWDSVKQEAGAPARPTQRQPSISSPFVTMAFAELKEQLKLPNEHLVPLTLAQPQRPLRRHNTHEQLYALLEERSQSMGLPNSERLLQEAPYTLPSMMRSGSLPVIGGGKDTRKRECSLTLEVPMSKRPSGERDACMYHRGGLSMDMDSLDLLHHALKSDWPSMDGKLTGVASMPLSSWSLEEQAVYTHGHSQPHPQPRANQLLKRFVPSPDKVARVSSASSPGCHMDAEGNAPPPSCGDYPSSGENEPILALCRRSASVRSFSARD